jgi:hypothetical protein
MKEMEERWLRHSWAGAPVREKGGEAVRRARKGEKGGEGASTPFMALGVPCSAEGGREDGGSSLTRHGGEGRETHDGVGLARGSGPSATEAGRCPVWHRAARSRGREREKKVSCD